MRSLHAVVDIGSNSAKLMIAALEDGKLTPLVERVGTPRLGDLGESGEVTPQALDRLDRVLGRFRQTLSNTGLKPDRVVMTEAVRRAANRDEVVERAERALRARPEIISGEEEAELAWLAVRVRHGVGGFACLDVGAGSSELSTKRSRLSIPMGALSLARETGPTPQSGEIRTMLRERLDAYDFAPFAWRPVFVSGGTAVALAAISLGVERLVPAELEGFVVEEGLIDRTATRLRDLSEPVRSAMPGLEEGRSAIVVPGLQMIAMVLERLHPVSVKVSALGVRYGALAKLLLPPPEELDEPEAVAPPEEPSTRRRRRR